MHEGELEDILLRNWGYPKFRNPQLQIIQSVIRGTDTIAILPTGGGKSLCFQVPALALSGLTIVVSPLIALMRDQVQQLTRRGIEADSIHSALSSTSIDRIYDNARLGKVKLLYVSPERLMTRSFLQFADDCKISLVAIDEAHCISQWGYDFRPAYIKIKDFLDTCPSVPVIALTASANKQVQADIVSKLGLNKPKQFIISVTRSELAYRVKWVASKSDQILALLKQHPGTAIIYLQSRRKTQDLAKFLKLHGQKADFYHAGLQPNDREKKQDAWIKDQSRIMVATNAFGMGIDKPNVRLVIHVDIPESIEAYYQEAGRAGRDGLDSVAYLLYNPSQWEDYESRQREAFPDIKVIQKVYQDLCAHFQIAIGAMPFGSLAFDLEEFCKKYYLPANQTWKAIQLLEHAGWLEYIQNANQSSTIEILIAADELIRFQHQKFDPLLQAILRLYPGLFDFQKEISENKLSELLKIPVDDVKQTLEELQKMGILVYQRQELGSRMIFLKERVTTARVHIDKDLYQFRKNRMEMQLSSMRGYIYGKTCRSRYIASYFDEHKSKDCGICDICIAQRGAMSTTKVDAFWSKIKHRLLEGPVKFETLLESASEVEYNEAVIHLQTLQTEGKIKFENNSITLA